MVFDQPELLGLIQSFLPVPDRARLWHLFPQAATKYDQPASCKKHCLRVMRRRIRDRMADRLDWSSLISFERQLEADAQRVMEENDTHQLALCVLDRLGRMHDDGTWTVDNQFIAWLCIEPCDGDYACYRNWDLVIALYRERGVPIQ